MKQIDTSNEIVASTKKEIPFWNRWSTVLSCVALAGMIYLVYGSWWVPRQECKKQIQYNPANTVTTEGYYTIGEDKVSPYKMMDSRPSGKYKTQEEAISFCVQSK